MDCKQCKLTLNHRHHTKEDTDFILKLFQKAENTIPKPFLDTTPCIPEIREAREIKYKKEFADRKNEVVWLVDAELIRLGKIVKFPVPEKVYEKYYN